MSAPQQSAAPAVPDTAVHDTADPADSAPADSASGAASPSAPDATYDVIVLGGGPVGENAAQYAIESTDLTAAIVEEALLGGECSYYACMPSKALLRPIDVARTTETLPGVATAALEPEALLARRDDWVSHYDDAGQARWAEGAGLALERGHGRLVGERRVEVLAADGTRRVLAARHAVILATGSEAAIPGPLQGIEPWTSRDATGVVEVPERLVIIGGGVVACEAATWMRALGAAVTMLVRGDSLLSSAEPFAGEAVAAGLEEIGVRIVHGARVAQAHRPQAQPTGLGRIHGGPVSLRCEDGTEHEADEVLVATGRRPRLGDVGLESIGLGADEVLAGRLPAWLHAVGDASGEAPLTHWGKHRARVVGARIAAAVTGAQPPFEVPDAPVPQVVFTDPQVASIGETEAQARERGAAVVTAQVPFGAAAGTALLRDAVPGRAQIVVDRATGLLLGAAFVGPEAAELVHAATVAITGRVPVAVLRHAVASYPTASELWLRLLEELPRELRAPVGPPVSAPGR